MVGEGDMLYNQHSLLVFDRQVAGQEKKKRTPGRMPATQTGLDVMMKRIYEKIYQNKIKLKLK